MSPLRNQRGMVLLLVLVVVALLAALLSEFSFSSLVDLRLAETFRDSTRAYYLAKGGIQAGRMLLQDDHNDYDGPGELWSQGVYNYPVGDGSVSIRAEDLDGRIDLNRLVDNLGNPVDRYKNRCLLLFSELGFSDPAGLVDSLIDWLDFNDNDQKEPLGAESPYYLGLSHPYPAKNGPLDSLDELLLVKGFDADILATLEPHVTVHGSDSLNVNTASQEVLMAWDQKGELPQQAAEAIVNQRQTEPFHDIQQLQDLIGVDNFSILNRNVDIVFISDTFRITAQGAVGDGSRTIQAIVRKSGNKILYQRVD